MRYACCVNITAGRGDAREGLAGGR